jgi:hypothetical protein
VFLVIVVILAAALAVLGWFLVQSAPRVLSMVLPRTLTFAIGVFFFILSLLSAFIAAYVLREPETMLHSFVQVFVGLWFMLATTSGMRGSREDDQFLYRVFLMVSILMGVIIASLYAPNNQALAALQLVLIAAGFWVTTNYLRLIDRGR